MAGCRGKCGARGTGRGAAFVQTAGTKADSHIGTAACGGQFKRLFSFYHL